MFLHLLLSSSSSLPPPLHLFISSFSLFLLHPAQVTTQVKSEVTNSLNSYDFRCRPLPVLLFVCYRLQNKLTTTLSSRMHALSKTILLCKHH